MQDVLHQEPKKKIPHLGALVQHPRTQTNRHTPASPWVPPLATALRDIEAEPVRLNSIFGHLLSLIQSQSVVVVGREEEEEEEESVVVVGQQEEEEESVVVGREEEDEEEEWRRKIWV